MTMAQLQQKEEKGNTLRVFQVTSGDYYVESSKGKVCYRVSLDNNDSGCTCGDYNSNIQNDKNFTCKHMLAAMKFSETDQKPRLDDRFVMEIQGNEFVKYAGVLDLGHQKGIARFCTEAVQYPTKENGNEAICKATLISKEGEEYIDYGDANPLNVTSRVVKHILRVASTRAKARVLRDFTNIGMTCLEELADFDEVETPKKETAPEKSNVRPFKKPKEEKDAANKKTDTPAPEKDQEKKEEPPKEQSPEQPQKTEQAQSQTDNVVKIATAQMQAIINLAKRRGLTEDDIRKRIEDNYHVSFEAMNSTDAKGLIRQLQQSA
ncbi:MAG: SWIM zinc finger family protein [Proteobacteria bacterium]|nr:SWIM zinc finger family protein [Pseudomonadota bacterium]